MTPQELRIGSIVHYLIKDEIDERKQYYDHNHIDWQDLKECVDDNETFNKWHKPVPLTEEILLKCGFEKIHFTDGYFAYQIDHTDYTKFGNPIHSNTEIWKCYRCEKHRGEWYFSIHKDPRSKEHFTRNHIHYLHQIQNLYYCLVGKELEINL